MSSRGGAPAAEDGAPAAEDGAAGQMLQRVRLMRQRCEQREQARERQQLDDLANLERQLQFQRLMSHQVLDVDSGPEPEANSY